MMIILFDIFLPKSFGIIISRLSVAIERPVVMSVVEINDGSVDGITGLDSCTTAGAIHETSTSVWPFGSELLWI